MNKKMFMIDDIIKRKHEYLILKNCLFRHPQSPQPPQYIYWQRNDRMVNYDGNNFDAILDFLMIIIA